jgi:uncharacterized membrane protein SirB2
MLANLMNTLIGLVMVYAAVLNPRIVAPETVTLFFLGLIILGFAIWARMTDSASWFSQTNVVVGFCVLALAALQHMKLTGSLMDFWGVFWCGLVVSVVAFWAALYRPLNVQ